MLTAIRERASGWIAWLIVVLLCIPFAFWGINTYFEGEQQLSIAKVDGDSIDYYEYQNALAQRRRSILSQSPNLNPDFFSNAQFKRGIVEGIIDQQLLTNDASDNGYRMSDRQLSESIRTIPDFQSDGRFDQQLYLNLLSNAGYSTARFEEVQRRQSSLSQMNQGLESGSFALEAEIMRLISLQLQERKARYLTVLPARFAEEIEVSDEEIMEEYENNPARYTEAARIKVEYVELSVDGIAASIQPTEKEIESYYEKNREQYVTPTQRQASHILIKPEQPQDEAETQASDPDAVALEKARDLLRQLTEGADFAELAKEHSEDPGSGRNGGDLGNIEPGLMVKPFEEAVFAMDEVGQLTEEPVKTRFGYHIIRLTDYTPETVKTLEEARPEVIEEITSEQAGDLFSERAETLRNLAYEQPDTLEPAFDEIGLEIKQSDWFNENNGEGVAANLSVREAAFNSEVLEEELNSEAIEVDLNTLVVVRKLEYEAQHVSELEEVREEIEKRVHDRKAADKVRDYGTTALADLRATDEDGESDEETAAENAWETLVKTLEAEVTELPLRKDQATAEQREIAQAVFDAPRPQPEHIHYGGVQLGSGGYALFALESVNDDIDMESEEAVSARDSVRDSLRQRHGNEYFSSLLEGLKGRASIEIYEQNL